MRSEVQVLSPRIARLVDTSCQRVFSFDTTVTYGERASSLFSVHLVSNGQGCTPLVSSWCKRWCKQWCKRSRHPVVCPGCPDGFSPYLCIVQGQGRQGGEGAGHIKQFRIG